MLLKGMITVDTAQTITQKDFTFFLLLYNISPFSLDSSMVCEHETNDLKCGVYSVVS